jgi:hypothetical protein
MSDNNEKERLKNIHSSADEQRILSTASRTLGIDQDDLILTADEDGLLIKRLSTQECWQVERLHNLPEIEPAN